MGRLDGLPGIYFGSDAGVAGMHPARALLLVDPSIALRVFDDGVEAEALDAFGAALLGHASLAPWRGSCGRAAGRDTLAALRGFLDVFRHGADTDDDAILAGALRFEAHRLGPHAAARGAAAGIEKAGGVPLGVFFFSARTLQRDGAGAWSRVTLVFDDEALARAAVAPRTSGAGLVREPTRSSPAEARDDFPRGGYAQVVARALGELANAGLVSLTLSQSFRRRIGQRSAAKAFARLRAVNPAPASFMFGAGDGESVFGASPDLQLLVRGREIASFPVCGTVARGHGPVGEAEALRTLFNEEVDAASLAVCSDALRNDLAPLCEPGSLQLVARRRPMTLATVVHAVDHLSGRLREGVDAWDAIAATAAPVMVTGTPRAAALAVIASHEAGPRGWYGGLVAEVRASGDARVGTILRAAAIRDGVAEVRAGGDLLAESDPAREELESRIKAVSLWRALGLGVDADLEASIAGSAASSAVATSVLPRAVALVDGGDPFAAAVADTLRGFGLEIDAAAATRVLVGGDDALARDQAERPRGLVALGDAAARVLRGAGVAVGETSPQHGRLVTCVPVPGALGGATRSFVAMRYATLALAATMSGHDLGSVEAAHAIPGWSPWLRDEAGQPLVLAREADRTVCFLVRPESLLSDPLARDVLRAAIAFAFACG
jgi:anthranilate/para-aminobenzoate synthase component I